MVTSTIVYTKTDEAPALATYSLLPIIHGFVQAADIDVDLADISLAGRIIAQFSDYLTEDQHIEDGLAELGQLALQHDANIIKLPNISASMPQLKAAIKELQLKGFALPDYPDSAETEEQKGIQQRYDKIKGSAVNPVLREGNSDRRAPSAVKNFVRQHPHTMGQWNTESKTHVASMKHGDFYSSEKSVTLSQNDSLSIVLFDEQGKKQVLKDDIAALNGEIVDAAVMNKKALCQFIEEQMDNAKQQGVLFSLHLKATMMKVSDPIIFGHVVSVFYKKLFDKHQNLFNDLAVNVRNGLGDIYSKTATLDKGQQAEILADIGTIYAESPDLAMVDSDKGITNLHVPSDVIIDASMPAMIRSSGQMWNKKGQQQDAKAIIPDRCYAGVYQKTIEFCKQHGAFDPATMGSVSNVGLMAQKAEEYGSHDKTFEIPANGTVKVIDKNGNILLEHQVEQGDIWRMCSTKDLPVQDWVKLAVNRARQTGNPAVFWLDKNRAHDAELIRKVERYLQEHDTSGLELPIMTPQDAVLFSLERTKNGLDTISVTGNVLRDYLTDLFPILELGTSAKMLSIVPLMNGGGLFETGAGGSAPKHVQQLLQENHLRWDSLGEFLALAASLEHLGEHTDNSKAKVLAKTLDSATGLFLEKNKSPSRKVGELDNRGSHFYLALYWAQALVEQNDDLTLSNVFSPLAKILSDNEQRIVNELASVQGKAVDLDGYYYPDPLLVTKVMQPSPTFNAALSVLS